MFGAKRRASGQVVWCATRSKYLGIVCASRMLRATVSKVTNRGALRRAEVHEDAAPLRVVCLTSASAPVNVSRKRFQSRPAPAHPGASHRLRVPTREVAREAGASVATVSRVLNGSGQASAATREKIREVAERLRYAPNEAARSLIRSSTRTLGVLLPDLHGEFFSELMRGIDQRARQDGFHLLISNFHADAREMEATLRAMRGRVDALILMSPDVDTRDILADVASGTATVLLNSTPQPTAGADVVTIDNVGGARAMVRHLVRQGYRRIAMIKGPERNHDSRERLRGYRSVLRAARLPVLAELEVAG